MLNLTVLILESNFVFCYSILLSNSGEIEIKKKVSWDPTSYLTDNSGTRFFEEIVRRIKKFWADINKNQDYIIISLPGTLKDRNEIISSSRLGIREPINLGQKIERSTNVPCYLFHDTECLSQGELKYGEHLSDIMPSSIVYVFVDEGIGSKIFINGKPYLGAGTAGLLGRLIVEPEGPFYPALRSNGPLEVYSSRPWISRQLVELYISELGKKIQDQESSVETHTKFQLALSEASQKRWDLLSYHNISDGLIENNPIALKVIDNAAKNLGYALNTIITLINPNLIILGGAVIKDIPNFANLTIGYARQYSWANAWNGTDIRISVHDRDIQVLGSVDLLINTLQNEKLNH